MYQRFFKRLLDASISFVALVLLSPVLLVLAVCIKISSPGPVLFCQKRVGKGKTYFQIYKFRSMRTDTPKDMPTHLLENPQAFITPIGRFLRKTSLDELPQLLNILRGEMSIVGPRPALWNQDDLIAQRDLYGANDCVPGLTGYAQIHGRDELPIEQKAKLDGYYAQHLSFALDVKIFFKTIYSVLRHEGVVEGKQP